MFQKKQNSYFYAGIIENNLTNNKIYIRDSETVTNQNYSFALKGGMNYQLFITSSINNVLVSKAATINSIKVYQNGNNLYGFREENGKYLSTNQNKDCTLCSSYIPIDLRNTYGTYKLTVNAEIATRSSDGFCYISESPENDKTSNRFINLDYTTSARNYSTEIIGGKLYYLHMCYQKGNYEYSASNDTFTINSIDIERSDTYLNRQTISTLTKQT